MGQLRVTGDTTLSVLSIAAAALLTESNLRVTMRIKIFTHENLVAAHYLSHITKSSQVNILILKALPFSPNICTIYTIIVIIIDSIVQYTVLCRHQETFVNLDHLQRK